MPYKPKDYTPSPEDLEKNLEFMEEVERSKTEAAARDSREQGSFLKRITQKAAKSFGGDTNNKGSNGR